jgi:hypothetical protein
MEATRALLLGVCLAWASLFALAGNTDNTYVSNQSSKTIYATVSYKSFSGYQQFNNQEITPGNQGIIL